MGHLSKIYWGLCLLFFSMTAMALGPTSEFEQQASTDSVISFKHKNQDIELSKMDSDLTYKDLTKESLKEIEKLMVAKQEYGTVFGFKEWKAEEKKFIEENSNRLIVIQGQYKNAENKPVHFLEIYWANAKTSGQYLVTSNTEELKIDNYKAYLK